MAEGGIEMTKTIRVAILSLIGTLVGAFLSSNKTRAILEVRIDDLSKKVEKHNNMIERVYILEGKMTEAEHDIRDLKAR